jgi:hypothetical protein
MPTDADKALLNRCISRPANHFHVFWQHTASGMQIAFLLAAGIFPLNRIGDEQSST